MADLERAFAIQQAALRGYLSRRDGHRFRADAVSGSLHVDDIEDDNNP